MGVVGDLASAREAYERRDWTVAAAALASSAALSCSITLAPQRAVSLPNVDVVRHPRPSGIR